jgi:hypothetical protein
MKMLNRIERLEARVPRPKCRLIFSWVDGKGRKTKVWDSMPHLPDHNHYDRYSPQYPGDEHGLAQTN